jgi:DNA-directed RNA polymerase subunit RPC12/RpoP
MKRIYDFMCLKCWHSWRKNADTALKTTGIRCPKCGSDKVDVTYDARI